MSARMTSELDKGLATLDQHITSEQAGRLQALLDELGRWNRRINLTAITDSVAMVSGHVLDSLVVRPWLEGPAILDIGTGAGFPGLPIKIIRPDVELVLIDASRKKVSFMQQVIRLLGLNEAAAHHMRAETLIGADDSNRTSGDITARKSLKSDRAAQSLPLRYDIVIARALSSDGKLLLVDEPTAGMNPAESQQLAQTIQAINAGGMAVLVIEHDMNFIKNLCTRVVAMDYGQKIVEGRYAEVRHHPKVVEAYLGRA